ncbi:MAG TPA: peptidyl-prolyl cis-trans isomerase [Terriglobales bacterium]|nr:peptidyl-prolyl cis-trans isomerase [Terriglobales bacterium]
MKSSTIACILVLATVSAASAQMVASHASTAAPRANVTNVLQPTGRPVARVNGAVLTDRDLLREMYTIFPYARQHNGGFPAAMETDIRQGALKMIVFEELCYQEAQRRGMGIPTAKMQGAVAEFRKQFHSPDQYQQFLKQEGISSKDVRARIRRSLLIDAFLKEEVSKKAAVTLVQAKTYYQKNLDRFRVPEAFTVQTISILPPQNATPQQLKEAKRKAEDAISRAKTTKNYEEFGTLAEQISEDDWRVMMGDHRAVDRSKLPPEVLSALQKMKPGEVSDLISVGPAYTIVRLNALTPAGTRKFAEVKDSIRKDLQRDRTERLRSALGQKLRKNAKIEEL